MVIMTNQDKKQWLRRYIDLNRAINQKLGELASLKALCEKATSVMSDMPKGGGSDREDRYIRLVDMRNEINAEIDRYVDLRQEIVDAIRTVPGLTLQTLLKLRYLDDMKWEQIAVDLNHDYRYVLKLHGRALEAIEIRQ